jgi:hypothetical protein
MNCVYCMTEPGVWGRADLKCYKVAVTVSSTRPGHTVIVAWLVVTLWQGSQSMAAHYQAHFDQAAEPATRCHAHHAANCPHGCMNFVLVRFEKVRPAPHAAVGPAASAAPSSSRAHLLTRLPALVAAAQVYLADTVRALVHVRVLNVVTARFHGAFGVPGPWSSAGGCPSLRIIMNLHRATSTASQNLCVKGQLPRQVRASALLHPCPTRATRVYLDRRPCRPPAAAAAAAAVRCSANCTPCHRPAPCEPPPATVLRCSAN